MRDDHIKLAAMAGQIADFFRPYPDDEAIAAIAHHINQFWTPRMRISFVRSYQPEDPALAVRVGKAFPMIRTK